jgi:hypothetical protein
LNESLYSWFVENTVAITLWEKLTGRDAEDRDKRYVTDLGLQAKNEKSSNLEGIF